MDFTGMSGNHAMASNWHDWSRQEWELFYAQYKLPVFHNKDEAVDWSHRTKWVEPVRRKIYREIRELRDIAYLNSHKLTVTSIHKAGDIMQLVSYYETALEQMEQYKSRQEVGALSDVGAAFYAGSIPLK